MTKNPKLGEILSNKKEPQNVLDKTLKDVWDEITYKDQMGQKTQVQRQSFGGESSEHHNHNLRRIGLELKEGSAALKELDYLGSIAVHYYRAPVTGSVAFVSQSGSIGDTPEIIVQDGITDLRNAMLELFGHKAQVKRSGF